MVRHTGDYLLGTMFLAAALILQLSHANVHSATKSPRNKALADAAGNVSPEKSKSPLAFSAVETTPSPAVNAVLTNLPRGTRIVVGSLDITGARHQIRLTSHNDGLSNGNCLDVARFTTESIRHEPGPETIRSVSSRSSSRRHRQFVQMAAFEMQPEDSQLLPNISNAVYRSTADASSAKDELVISNHDLPTSTAAHEQSARVFLMPHFTNDGTSHEPAECRLIGKGQRVLVYADRSLPHASSSDHMRIWAARLVSAAELKALPIAEKWIGPICDVDRNKKLSIVVTDLDQHRDESPGRSPVFGCIRESDFCPESDFCGDIVYIDQNIFELPSAELHGLLTHEIAHAAICTMNNEVSLQKNTNSLQNAAFFAPQATAPIPPWLNEAVAHIIELQSSDKPNAESQAAQEIFTENFQRRIDAFLAGANNSPIVASENTLNLEERRSGSRGAATLFLAPLISTPRDLQKLLRSSDSLQDRIEDLAQEPFADAFRNWTLAIASINNDTECLSVEKIEANLQCKHCSVLGTAFHCFECSDDISTLVLTSNEQAQLQISIIEPAVRNAQVAQSMR